MVLTAEPSLPPYKVRARNTAAASENKIHDDAVAKRFGFTGGLVPGVEVYAYMTHLPVAHWGRAWLEHGRAECRFLKPVYDGELASVTAKGAERGLEIAVATDSRSCAVGTAFAPDSPAARSFEEIEPVSPRGARAAADEDTLAPGTRLGIAPLQLTQEFLTKYLDGIGETHGIYAEEGLCHPGILLRLCNWALMQNVVLGPWIHTASKVQHFALARVGDELSVQATITANYERKGHRLVDLRVLILADARRLIARVEHTAIWQLRQR